jgi:hypothetical protein
MYSFITHIRTPKMDSNKCPIVLSIRSPVRFPIAVATTLTISYSIVYAIRLHFRILLGTSIISDPLFDFMFGP